MKHKTLYIIFFAATFLFYTACKKSSVNQTPATATVDYKILGSQMVTSLYSSFSGQNHGLNFNPIKSSALRGKNINDVSSLCGYTVDSTYTAELNYGQAGGNYTLPVTNSYQLTYTCAGGNVNGYSVIDSLTGVIGNTGYSLQIFQFGQHLSVLTPTSQTATVNGVSYYNYQFSGNGTPYQSLVENYLMTGLTMNYSGTDPDIITGTISFTGSDYLNPPFSSRTEIDGTITFLGNFVARVQFSTDNLGSYTYNIITGQTLSIN